MGDSVLVVNAGGTIGMVETPQGHAPVAGALGPYLDWIVENSGGELAPISFLELDPPIDSANATPDDWCTIARTLFERREDHDGFVVLHGTDTMAYTSSALSFLLPVFGRPVVVTGSQIPIARIRSDGRQNFIGALQVAARVRRRRGHAAVRRGPAQGQPGHEDGRLGPRCLRLTTVPATRRTSASTSSCSRRARPPARGESRGSPPGDSATSPPMRLFPGFSASILANLCRPPLQGLVIEAYGAGNGPANDRDFLAAIEAAAGAGSRRGGRHAVRPGIGAARAPTRRARRCCAREQCPATT